MALPCESCGVAAESFVCGSEEAGLRLDIALVRRVKGMTRAQARALTSHGKVKLNGRTAKKGTRVEEGDQVDLLELPMATDFIPEADPELSLSVIHEDEYLVVVDKPAGVPCHPLRSDEKGTVVQAMLARYPDMAGVGYSKRESGLVHRLDIDTSGLLMLVRGPTLFETLRDALRAHRIDKRYIALAAGEVVAPRLVDLPIANHPSDAKRVVACIDEREIARLEPRPAVTEILRSEKVGDCSMVEISARSARRHQVRAHLAALGHALVGDRIYGGPEHPGLERHFLHASRLVFDHPRDGRRLELEAPLPAELRSVVEERGI